MKQTKKLWKRIWIFAMVIIMVVSTLSVSANSNGDNDSTINAYVTISTAGSTKLAYKEVAVTDTNNNGKFDMDDALYAAHESYYSGGAAEGYLAETTVYGRSLVKLWGATDGIGGYRLNNDWVATSLEEEISDGDYVYAYSYSDLNGWSDSYSYFHANTVKVNDRETVDLILTYSYYDANWTIVDEVFEGATLTVNGVATNVTTDAEGKASITFDTAGTYLVSATSTSTILVPPVCVVTVEDSENSNVVKVENASELPTVIEAGKTYELTADITLASGQQIETLAGVLDGKGHTITLADKPLANTVTGTIQNLGVKGTLSMSSSNYEGSIANNLDGGTIQNSYSIVSITTADLIDGGGLIGTMKNNSSVKNCYFGGTVSLGRYSSFGGITCMASVSNIASNTYYTTSNYKVYGSASTLTLTNCVSKEMSDFTSGSVTSLLNTGMIDTGYIFSQPTDGANNGYPVLIANAGGIKIDKTALDAEITKAEQLSESIYTTSTWTALTNALTEAKIVSADEDATQQQVNDALSTLEIAIAGLEKIKPTQPVAPPTDESQIIHIDSQDDIEYMANASDSSKYYVLDKDVEIGNLYFNMSTFEGILDGNGHSIIYDSSAITGLFKTVGVNGVIQNVHFKGTLDADYGACAQEVKGAIINCYSELSGSNSSGFVKRLNGGVISNCYSISKASDGAIVETTVDANGNNYKGTFNNVYWQSGLTMPSDLSNITMNNSGALSQVDMKTLDFVDTLNANKGTYGVSWGQSSNGYPYFGENQAYNPEDQFVLTENKTAIAFTPNDGTETIIENQEVKVDKNIADGFGIVGTFSLPEYTIPDGARVEWTCGQQMPDNTAASDWDTGELYVYGTGQLVVTATLVNADNTTEILATAKVTVYTTEIEDIQLWIGERGNNNTVLNIVEIKDGKATVNGSEEKTIVIKAKYVGENLYKTISDSDFTFELTDPDGAVYHRDNSSVFRFEKPGTATMTVTYNEKESVTETVELTSAYVAVDSVKPAIDKTVTIHGRNANSASGTDYLPLYTSIVVDPSNASYSGDFTITSSDPSVAQYVVSMVNGYVPYKAGTVTFTATIDDNGTTKTGTETVAFVYKNPVEKVSVKDDTITLKNGEIISAGLEFQGTLDDGSEITETGMIWSYDKDGIVTMVRDNGAFVRDDSSPDNGYYFLSSEYKVRALSEGSVKVTGTPIDDTAGAEPVTFTVTVEANSDLEAVDIDKIISSGIATSESYLNDQIATAPEGMTYGYEWHIMTLLRAGKDIDATVLNEYYDAVVKEVKTWDGTEKPTDIERVALAVAAMGKDITDVGGVDLAEMIYNSDKLADGSNELVFALLALDAVDVEIPSTAKWSRDAMVSELLKFQNAETGAFGLYNNQTASIDMTAMSIQALAPYKNDPAVASAIEDALDYLRGEISGNYDFADSNATAQVLMALAVMGIDVTDASEGFGNLYSNIITRLDEYRNANGEGFVYILGDKKTNPMATIQVMQAFDAYRKAHDEGINYWEFVVVGDEYEDEDLNNSSNSNSSNDNNSNNNDANQNNGSNNNGSTENKPGATSPETGDFTGGTPILPMMMVIIFAGTGIGLYGYRRRQMTK